MIAAAVETIDRVGPCDAKFEIEDVEDVRSSKRQYIVDRAKALLQKLSSKLPESREIENEISSGTKTAKIVSYGEEKLAAGPDIDSSKEIVVVEGRADVLTLLRAGIKNAIAMNGTVLPKTVVQLSEKKDVTLFIDGDRGGLLIVQGVLDSAKVKSIARAPDGKEVEELTSKEILSCLRQAISVSDFKKHYLGKTKTSTRKKTKTVKETKVKEEKVKDVKVDMEDLVKEIKGTKKCAIVLLTSTGSRTFKKPASETTKFLYSLKRNSKKIAALAIDGTLTATILKIAETLGCKEIAAKNFQATSDKIKFLSF